MLICVLWLDYLNVLFIVLSEKDPRYDLVKQNKQTINFDTIGLVPCATYGSWYSCTRYRCTVQY